MYYFVFLLAEKLLGLGGRTAWYTRVYTLLAVLVGWVIFRSESLPAALQYLGVMFGAGAESPVDPLFWYYLDGGKWVLLTGLVFSTPVTRLLKARADRLRESIPGNRRGPARLMICASTGVQAVSVLLVFALSLLACINSTYNPFIYFNF